MIPSTWADLEEPYARQRADTLARQARGQRIAGWKVGVTSAQGQRTFGLCEPLLAPLFDDMLLKDGARVRCGDYTQLRLEPELAVIVGAAPPMPIEVPADAAALVQAVAPAFELIDARLPAAAPVSELIADGIARAGVVLGPRTEAFGGLARAIDRTRCLLRIGGGEPTEVDAEAIIGGPLASLAWISRALPRLGEKLRTGQLVLTGTWTPPVDAEARDGADRVLPWLRHRSGPDHLRLVARVTLHDPRRSSPNVTLAVLAMVALTYAVLQSLMAPAMPGIQRAFHAGANDASWIFTAFLLAAAVGTPILGRLGDMYGKERWLRVALALIACGSLVGATAPSLPVLVAARAIQGLGAGVFPLAFGVLRDELPRERVAGAIGQLSAIIGIGGGAGVVLSGMIIEAISWRWLFWIPCVVSIVGIPLVRRYVPPSPVRAPGRVNWLAAALMTTALSAMLLALSNAPTWGWGSRRTLALAIGAVGFGAAWMRVELRSAVPLIDTRMMRLRPVWTANLAAFLSGISTYSVVILIPELVTSPPRSGVGFGASVAAGGVYLLPWTTMVLVAGMITGRIATKYGSKSALMAGAVLVTGAAAQLVVAHDAPWTVYFTSGLCGFGVGLTFAALPALIVAAVPPEQTSVASAMNNVTRQVGGAFGTQLAATLLATDAVGGLPTEHGYESAFTFILAAAVLGVAATLLVPGRGLATGAASTLPAPPHAPVPIQTARR